MKLLERTIGAPSISFLKSGRGSTWDGLASPGDEQWVHLSGLTLKHLGMLIWGFANPSSPDMCSLAQTMLHLSQNGLPTFNNHWSLHKRSHFWPILEINSWPGFPRGHNGLKLTIRGGTQPACHRSAPSTGHRRVSSSCLQIGIWRGSGFSPGRASKVKALLRGDGGGHPVDGEAKTLSVDRQGSSSRQLKKGACSSDSLG